MLAGRLERRSEKGFAAMTWQLDGVVSVLDRLTWRPDDTRPRPDEQTLHGAADGRLREW